MDWLESLGVALALLLVLEGVLPLFAPGLWRQLWMQLLQLRDGSCAFADCSVSQQARSCSCCFEYCRYRLGLSGQIGQGWQSR